MDSSRRERKNYMQVREGCMQEGLLSEGVASFELLQPEIRIMATMSGSGLRSERLRSELESSTCLSDGSASVDTPDITSDLDQAQDDRNSSNSSSGSVSSLDSSRPVIIFDWDDTMYVTALFHTSLYLFLDSPLRIWRVRA